MGILDRVDVDALNPAERWCCRSCGRNGFTMNQPKASRRVEPCPDCGEPMDVWPSGESQSTEPKPVAESEVPLALRFLTEDREQGGD